MSLFFGPFRYLCFTKSRHDVEHLFLYSISSSTVHSSWVGRHQHIVYISYFIICTLKYNININIQIYGCRRSCKKGLWNSEMFKNMVGSCIPYINIVGGRKRETERKRQADVCTFVRRHSSCSPTSLKFSLQRTFTLAGKHFANRKYIIQTYPVSFSLIVSSHLLYYHTPLPSNKSILQLSCFLSLCKNDMTMTVKVFQFKDKNKE